MSDAGYEALNTSVMAAPIPVRTANAGRRTAVTMNATG